MTVIIKYKIIGFNDPIPIFNIEEQEQSESRVAPIGPGVSIATQRVFLDDNEVASFWGSGHRLIVYCRVQYKDIFRKEKMRHTQICGDFTILNMPTTEWNYEMIKHSFSPVGQQNSAD